MRDLVQVFLVRGLGFNFFLVADRDRINRVTPHETAVLRTLDHILRSGATNGFVLSQGSFYIGVIFKRLIQGIGIDKSLNGSLRQNGIRGVCYKYTYSHVCIM